MSRDATAEPCATPIAIIGIGCRYPGGIVDPATFWQVVANGVDAISAIPTQRFDVAPYSDLSPGTRGRIATRLGGFVQQRLEEFDAMFFGISRTYAERLDPQHRLVLETSWEAMEDAGLDVAALKGSRTAVYVGQWVSDFEHHVFANPRDIDFQKAMGSGRYAAAGRVSFAFGFRGPCLSIDAACSSGLAAVHLAVQSLRSGESSLALAGGVNLILEPHIHVAYSDSQMLAPDGRCRFGDASGAGYVRSEGVGMVTLKRLDDAMADGDRVYAVIRGSAVNSDGDSSGSFGRPSRIGQEELIRSALEDGGVHPSQVSYVEAHGTGTKVGDPVEIDALAKVLADGRAADAPRTWVGSVKTNFGHTEAAAGAAGLIKTALMLQHEAIPPSLHFATPNPTIAWETLPIAIPTTLSHWPAVDGERFAGVSSYGIGGTNAHVVLQGVPNIAAASEDGLADGRAQLLVLSGQSRDALQSRVESVANWLDSGAGRLLPLPVTARTAALRRGHLSHRLGVVAHNNVAMVDALRAAVIEDQPRALVHKRIGFVFPGQGSQWAGMGRTLLATEPVFAAAIDACAEAMRGHVEWSLREVLSADTLSEEIDVVQPAIFAMQVSLAALWRSWGVVPVGVVGHSMGEVAAAYVAGALSLADAVRIVCVRSQLLRRVRGHGAMAVVELSATDARSAIASFAGTLAVAAENSPRSSVIAGDRDALETLVSELTARDVFAKLVKVDVASHSHHVDALLPELASALDAIAPTNGGISLYSTVAGKVVAGATLDATYWGENLRHTVQLSDAISLMAHDGIDIFIEVSPHPVLTTALTETLDAYDDATLVLPSMRRDVDGRTALLQTLGALYAAGVTPAWQSSFAAGSAMVSLPTYPFQRERFWLEDASPRRDVATQHSAMTSLLGARVRTSTGDGGSEWEMLVDAVNAPWIADHVVRDAPVVPAAAVVQAMIGAARELFGASAAALELRGVTFTEAIPIAARTNGSLRLTATQSEPGTISLRVRLRDDGDAALWRTVAGCRAVAPHDHHQPSLVERNLAVDTAPLFDDDGANHYAAMDARRLAYGNAFRVVCSLQKQHTQADAGLRAAEVAPAAVNTTLLDGALQVLLDLAPVSVASASDTLVPVAIQRVRVAMRDWPREVTTHAQVGETSSGAQVRGSLQLAGRDGEILFEAEGVDFAVVRQSASDELPAMRYATTWEPIALERDGSRTPQQWLVVADNTGLADDVARALRAAGDGAVVWHSDDLIQAAALSPDVSAMMILSALDVASANDDGTPPGRVEVALQRAYDVPLRALQLAAAAPREFSRTILVTCGAVAVHDSAEVTAPMCGTLWGLGRVAQREGTTSGIQLLDLDATLAVDEQARVLVRAAMATREDAELAVRGDLVFAGRLTAVVVTQQPSRESTATDAYRAEVSVPGLVESLQWRRVQRAEPAAGEVEIEVVATGLNFINVLSALGTYPDAPDGVGPLGLECAGRITQVGAGVVGLAVGDAIVAISEVSLGRYAIARAALVARVPDGISLELVAGFPIAFLTAHRALIGVGRLQRGERVLIHSAAGGVGLAAFQIATQLGAEIYATAGTPTKRALLQSMGAAGVFDSRSTDFGDAVLQATNGRGVDVVLNSLSGLAIDEGLRVLAPYGRFVELGKRDIFADRSLGMATLKREIVVTSVDLLAQSRNRAEALGETLRELLQQLARGELTLLPSQTFPAAQLSDAFRTLLPGTHVGKVIVTHAATGVTVMPAPARITVHADASYLIVGGLGTLGLAAARFLVSRGARCLVLAGRSAPSALVEMQLQQLRETGARIESVPLDIAVLSDVESLRERLRELPALRGVIQAAGVLDDGILTEQTAERMRVVAAAKMFGAANLEHVFALRDLDFFVSYSSVASALGTRGQANYAAANAFLDAQAHALRARGVAATSISFGPFADAGLATSGRGLAALRESGLRALRIDHADVALELLASGSVAHEIVAHWDAAIWARAQSDAAESRRLSNVLSMAGAATPVAPSVEVNMRQHFAQLSNERQRRDSMRDFVRSEVALALRVPVERVDATMALKLLGVDSLLALSLRNRLERATDLRLSATLIFSYPTVNAIADYLGGQLVDAFETRNTPEVEPVPVIEESQRSAADAEVDALAVTLSGLSEHELQRLLAPHDASRSA